MNAANQFTATNQLAEPAQQTHGESKATEDNDVCMQNPDGAATRSADISQTLLALNRAKTPALLRTQRSNGASKNAGQWKTGSYPTQ
jgi:hypothetical protein